MAGKPQPDTSLLNGHTLPFVVFLVLTNLAPVFPGGISVLYPLKTVIAVGMLWYCRHEFAEYREWRCHWSAVPVGLFVLAAWIGLDFLVPVESGFNPFAGVDPTIGLLSAAVRLAGSALVVPFLEELFWRSWLPRFLIDRDHFRQVPVGTFTWSSFLIACMFFGAEHGSRWLAGVVAGAAYAALVYRHREIRSATLAHGITNFGLGVYVLLTHAWQFW